MNLIKVSLLRRDIVSREERLRRYAEIYTLHVFIFFKFLIKISSINLASLKTKQKNFMNWLNRI